MNTEPLIYRMRNGTWKDRRSTDEALRLSFETSNYEHYLIGNGIPKSLFCESGDDILSVEDVLAPLIDYSFILSQGKGESFQVHRLVRLSTRE